MYSVHDPSVSAVRDITYVTLDNQATLECLSLRHRKLGIPPRWCSGESAPWSQVYRVAYWHPLVSFQRRYGRDSDLGTWSGNTKSDIWKIWIEQHGRLCTICSIDLRWAKKSTTSLWFASTVHLSFRWIMWRFFKSTSPLTSLRHGFVAIVWNGGNTWL